MKISVKNIFKLVLISIFAIVLCGSVMNIEAATDTTIKINTSKVVITKATSNKVATATLAWEKVENANGYMIYRAASKTGGFKKIKTISDVDKITFTNTGLKKGKIYYYKIRAYQKNGKTYSYSKYSDVKKITVKSKTKNQKACEAYKKLLSKEKIYWAGEKYNTKDIKFACKDINGDGVKELILQNYEAPTAFGWYRIYTYYKGEIKSLGAFQYLKFYPNKNYFVDEYVGMGNISRRYYRVKNGKRVKLAEYAMSDQYPYGYSGEVIKKYNSYYECYMYYHSFEVSGEQATYEECFEVINSLKKNAERAKYTFYKNTSANRKTKIK